LNFPPPHRILYRFIWPFGQIYSIVAAFWPKFNVDFLCWPIGFLYTYVFEK
jgi:hypothetical protein